MKLELSKQSAYQLYWKSPHQKWFDTAYTINPYEYTKYLSKFVTILPQMSGENNKFGVVRKELKVFKKLQDNLIANLALRTDTIIHWDYTSDKLRASNAFVYSIWDPKFQQYVKTGRSLHDLSFIYKVDTWVSPRTPFSFMHDDCRSGIHFFLDAYKAVNY